MLGKIRVLASCWKFAVYLAVIVIVSLAINFLIDLGAINLQLFIGVVFAVLAFVNFACSRIIFALDSREAILLGMLVGLVHSLICAVLTPLFL
jgi:hypothetical protein